MGFITELVTAKDLSEAIGKPLLTGTATIHCFGFIYQWSNPLQKFIQTTEVISFKPGQVIPCIADRNGRLAAILDI